MSHSLYYGQQIPTKVRVHCVRLRVWTHAVQPNPRKSEIFLWLRRDIEGFFFCHWRSETGANGRRAGLAMIMMIFFSTPLVVGCGGWVGSLWPSLGARRTKNGDRAEYKKLWHVGRHGAFVSMNSDALGCLAVLLQVLGAPRPGFGSAALLPYDWMYLINIGADALAALRSVFFPMLPGPICSHRFEQAQHSDSQYAPGHTSSVVVADYRSP